jgi:hypothetical protein
MFVYEVTFKNGNERHAVAIYAIDRDEAEGFAVDRCDDPTDPGWTVESVVCVAEVGQ